MSRLLALSLLVSTALVGCGGSGSSDGGSVPSPSEKYTFEFVRMITGATAPANCTIFDVDEQNSDAVTYAMMASDVKIEIHNADGTLKSQVLTVSEKGVLTFSKNDIADGGYISIIDSPSNDDLFYKVLSIQKELLGNYLISVKRPQSSTTCYEGGKAEVIDAGYPLQTDESNIVADAYNYETSHNSTVAQSSRRVQLEAYSNEKILEKAYHSNSLIGYTFISELTKDLEFTDTELVKINETLEFNDLTASNELSQLSIKIGNGEFSYPWYKVDLASEVSFPYVSIEQNWFYSAGGKTAKNWSFMRNGTISSAFDIQLPDSLTLTDTAPTISKSASSFIFENAGFNTTDVSIQRSFYTQTNGSSTTLNHSIYSIADSNGTVVIPDLKLTNLEPLNPDSIEVSVLAMETAQSDTIASFLRNEDSGDFVSIVLKPENRIKHNKAINMNDYTIVER